MVDREGIERKKKEERKEILDTRTIKPGEKNKMGERDA